MESYIEYLAPDCSLIFEILTVCLSKSKKQIEVSGTVPTVETTSFVPFSSISLI
ncbi:hypothetical protein NE686_03380 [Tissierella carlieri]|uniref:Uncharacterized protein n=1 Tax=Tissierella carlieri TaxID=689904 RepID=A0ABT1S6M3_9FIRM|nr:hypothetical protein [Tissierella carlieri]MCQ4922116.1 hypothetical protein [Tissierella carlieri]